jgi:cytochrome c oxidase subunit III
MPAEQLLQDEALPVGSIGRRSNGWWAMLFIMLTEGALFAYLLFAYYYLAVQPHTGPWPPNGAPSLHLALPNTLLLLASSVAAWWGERGIESGRSGRLAIGLAAALVLGTAFVGVQLAEWHAKPFGIASNSYGSLYFTITGFHMAHVVAGLLMLAAVLAWCLIGMFDRWRNTPVAVSVVYWHFVDAVWLAVFFTFYITPYLGLAHG